MFFTYDVAIGLDEHSANLSLFWSNSTETERMVGLVFPSV